MLRRLGIRGKVLAALSVPVLVLFLLAGLTSWQAIEEVRTTRAVQSTLDALDMSQEMTDAIQEERAVSVATFGVRASEITQENVDSAREASDRAIIRYRAAVADVNMSALDPIIGSAFEDHDRQLGLLTSARGFVDGGQVALASIDSNFADLLAKTTELPSRVADGLADRQLAGIVRVESQLSRLMEGYRHEAVLGHEVLIGSRTGANLSSLRSLINEDSDLRLVAAADLRSLRVGTSITEVVLSTDRDSFGVYREVAAEISPEGLDSIDPQAWLDTAAAEVSTVEVAANELDGVASSRASSVATATIREATLSIAATVAAVVVSIIIALSIARSIVRPLRRLTAAAGTVRDELPHLVEQVAIPGQGPDLALTRIPVTSQDEVGQLAAAFNEVNATTIEVAQEQAALRASIAEMFINVARRDQVLLNRQLSFIDALERSEEDPKTLADLFRLDHLATRMRRNAESLLVLAGIDTGRRLRGSLPTSDVIRTASSEIEHYERIQLDLPVDPFMLGHVALPAAHMLAELLENATVFSEPGTPVNVSTGIDESSVIITIEDQGLGMSQAEVDEANTRIRATSASDVLGAQRLGLYVVGRIATRLGASVELSTPRSGTGTLVTVRFPHVVFVEPDTIPLTPPSAAPVVETFVRPEEAAIVAHDSAYVPSGAGAWDVPAGAVGSLENPAEEVDLVELTDGTTDLGLPRRRSRAGADSGWDGAGEDDDAAAAASIPLAPDADSLASAARSRTDMWTPPVVQGPGLPGRPADSTHRNGVPTPFGASPVEGSNGSLPGRRSASVAASASGLPTRQPAPPREHVSLDTASATGPVNVEGRQAIFTGFRSRRAELAAAAIPEAGAVSVDDGGIVPSQVDGAERLAAAAAGPAAFFGRHVARPADDEIPGPEEVAIPQLESDDDDAATVEPPMVIPALVDDDDEFGFGDPSFAPDAPALPPLVDAEDEVEETPDEETPDEGRTEEAEAWLTTSEVSAPGAWAQDAPSPWATQPAPPVMQPEMQPEVQLEMQPEMQPEVQLEVQPEMQPEMQVEVAPAPPAESADFAALFEGPTRRESRPKPKRRRLFWRRRRTDDADQDYAQSPLARLAAGVDDDGAPLPFKGGRGPVRLSAWSSSDSGSHASVESPSVESPSVESPVVESPSVEQSPVEPAEPTAVPRAWEPDASAAPLTQWESSYTAFEMPQPSEPQPLSPEPWAQAVPETGPAVPPWANEPAALQEPVAPTAWGQGREHTPAAWSPPTPSQGGAPSWAPAAPDWSIPQGLPATTPPAAPSPTTPSVTGQTTFEPQSPARTFDDEMTNMLAQRADIAQQALSELSQLSTYRPQTVSGGGSGALQRRTPGSIPSAPEIGTGAVQSHRPARDAAQVRSVLSDFRSGTTRGRQVAEQGATEAVPQTAGDDGLAGSEAGPEVDMGQPVTTPDTDLDPRGTTW